MRVRRNPSTGNKLQALGDLCSSRRVTIYSSFIGCCFTTSQVFLLLGSALGDATVSPRLHPISREREDFGGKPLPSWIIVGVSVVVLKRFTARATLDRDHVRVYHVQKTGLGRRGAGEGEVSRADRELKYHGDTVVQIITKWILRHCTWILYRANQRSIICDLDQCTGEHGQQREIPRGRWWLGLSWERIHPGGGGTLVGREAEEQQELLTLVAFLARHSAVSRFASRRLCESTRLLTRAVYPTRSS